DFLELGLGPFGSPDRVMLAPGDERVEAFVAGAATDATSLSFLVPYRYNIGFLFIDFQSSFTIDPSCVAPKYVDQARLGARLIYGLKLSFRDAPARSAFVAEYGDNIAYILEHHDPRWLGASLDGKATIQLQAFQLGGKPEDLAAIVRKSTCSIGDLGACL